MKKSFKQGKSLRCIFFSIITIIIVSLSLFSLTACQEKLDVESIYIKEDTIPQNLRVSELNLSDIILVVIDSEGLESTVALSPTMLSTDSRNKLVNGGEHTITVRYQNKTTTFNLRVFNDGDDLVTVKFKDRNNNVIATMVTIKGTSMTPPAFPTVDGMIPDGWLDGANNKVNFGAVNESMEVKVKYVKDTQLHTVTFKDHNNNIIDTIQVEHGNRLPTTPTFSTPDGVASWDWYYGNNRLDIEKLVINQNITLNVKVENIKHTVTYFFSDNNGTRINLGSEQVQHNGAATGAQSAQGSVSTYGYNFLRWKTSFQSVKMDIDVEAEVSIFSYTVTFLDYNGKEIDNIEVYHGGNVIPIKQPTEWPGHVFTGEWEGGSLINIKQNLRLTARYVPQTKKIQLYYGVNEVEEVYKDFGTVIDADNLQELWFKEGCILLGIYKDALFAESFSLPYSIFNDTSFYLKWLDTTNGNNELEYTNEDTYREVAGYNGRDALIYIPSNYNGLPVTAIASQAFKDKEIFKINFGSNITEIRQSAFENTKLSGSLQLPEGLTKIGARAFANCEGLESITIPDSVIEINQGAFEGATNLKHVYISNDSLLRSIGDRSFKGCSSLVTINLSKIEVIGDYAFEDAKLENLALENIQIIGEWAFSNNSFLSTVDFGQVQSIAQYAFSATAISKIEIPTLVDIDSYAFANNKQLTEVNILVDELRAYTFSNCMALTQINLAQGISVIEDYAFHNCSSVVDIILPNTVSEVSARAFNGMHKLNTIIVDSNNNNYFSDDGILYDRNRSTIIAYPSGRIQDELIVPNTVSIVGKSAFENAAIARLILPDTLEQLDINALYSKFIVTIEFKGSVPIIADENDLISEQVWKLYVPANYLNQYKSVSVFSLAEESPTQIAGSIYDENSGLVYIVEDTITIVAADRTRTSIIVPENINGKTVNRIAAYAFQDCDKLQSIEIRGTIYELGEYAFKGCSSLTNITFYSIRSVGSVADININAFEDTPWYINNDLIVVATMAIEYKFKVDSNGEEIKQTSLVIPSNVQILNKDLFNNQAGRALESIILPQGLRFIGERAFFGSKITFIEIPPQVEKIEQSAFESSMLKTINISASAISVLEERVFADCSALQQIQLPLNVAFIKEEAFLNNTSLREVILPDSLTQIGARAFKGCISMPTIEIPLRIGRGLSAGELAIGNQAFQDCNSLVYVRMWNPTPPLIGQSVFDSGAYIYVESSSGTIINNYIAQWSEYDSVIRQQHDSPRVSFIANRDFEGNYIEALRGVEVASARVSVLYQAPEVPEVNGYLFVCWNYEITLNNWVPVEYPFLIPNNVTLIAKWVRTNEGSLSANDLYENTEMQGYEVRSYTGGDTKVVIPSNYEGKPIIIINENVFKGQASITDFIFLENSNIKYIRQGAFANLPNIRSIILPSSLIVIDDYAFENCTNLEYIFIPKSVKGIGNYAFAGCENLNIEFEDGSELRYAEIESFSDTVWYAEQKANEFANFVIAGQLVIEYLKNENQNLVTIPVQAIALKKELFMDDFDLATVELHSYIEFIGDKCFYNCISLVSVDFGSVASSQINYVGDDAFGNTPWQINQDIFVQVGGVLIEYRGSSLDVNLPDTITAIEEQAFAYKAITSVTLPRNLKTIARRAFFNCNNLEYIEIPAQVISIGEEAFAENINLKYVTFMGNNLKEIGQRAFYGCTSLGADDDLILPSSLNMLDKNAFEGCSALRGVNLQNTILTQISNSLFRGANNLSTISLPRTIINIGDNAFYGCTVLENVTIAANSQLKQISESAFSDTAWFLRRDEQEDSLIYLGGIFLKFRARIGGIKNINVVIPSDIKYIASRAFEDANLVTVQLPEGLLEIGEYAFYSCSQLQEVTIPNSTKKISTRAFSNCNVLATVSLGTGLEEVSAYAFANCYELYKVTINKIGFGELSGNKQSEIINAINSNTIGEWLQSNPDIFIGTKLISESAFSNASVSLRIYVVRDGLDINRELYLHEWQALASNIFNLGDLPTVSFVNVQDAKPIAPISTEWLTEADIDTVFRGHTLLGWEIVETEDAEDGIKISLPYRITRNIYIRPIWLDNDRPEINDIQLGFTYAPNVEQTGYLINSFTPNIEEDLLVIASKVRGHNLMGVNDGVFTEANTQHIRTIMITSNDNLSLLSKNIFNMFVNLERIIVDGKDFATMADYYGYTEPISSRYVSVGGILYTKDLKTLVTFPRAKKGEDGNGLSSFEIPSSVESILDYALKGSALISLHIPDSVLYIGTGAFDANYRVNPITNEVSGLRYITFAPTSQIVEVAYEAFNQTVWYREYNDAFIVAGTYLLAYNGYTDSVIIPNTIKTIGIRAFRNNELNNITKLTIPSSIVRINNDAFASCNNIIDIIFMANSQLMYVANDVFKDTSWIATMVGIEANEFIIAGNVLVKYQSGNEYITLPTEVKVIGHEAFNNASLKGITLHNGLERIDEGAFYGANNLESINIPYSVKSIGNSAFHSCMALGTVLFDPNSNLLDIGKSAFAYCQALSSISIPNNVKSIGNNAFDYCTSLVSVAITEGSKLEDLGSSAFKNAQKLVTIFIPDGLREIKASTFESCTSLLNFTFSSGNMKLVKIGENAFRSCTLLGSNLEGRVNLRTIELPYNVNTIETGAFSGCSGMYGIYMQGQIARIGAGAFSGCSNLANITINTAEPPSIEGNSFNYDSHPNVRVYVNFSENKSVRNAYEGAWGHNRVAKSENIFERNNQNLPLIKFYDYSSGGEEVHLSQYDMNTELLTTTLLPNIRHDVKGMAIGFYTDSNFRNQICTTSRPFEIFNQNEVKLYIAWDNS